MNPVEEAIALARDLAPDDEIARPVVEAFAGWRDLWQHRLAGEEGQWRGYRHDLGDYMHRVILQSPAGTLRLHKILRSDAGTDLHDHPWDFTSRLLRGAYDETRPSGVVQRFGPGDVNDRLAEDLHRLTVADGPVWTLVGTGPRRRRWGFATATGWIYWRDYTGARGVDDRGFEPPAVGAPPR